MTTRLLKLYHRLPSGMRSAAATTEVPRTSTGKLEAIVSNLTAAQRSPRERPS